MDIPIIYKYFCFMNKFLLTAAAAAMTFTAAAASAPSWRPGAQKEAFPFAPKAKAELRHTTTAQAGLDIVKAKAAAKEGTVTSASLPASSDVGYIDGPKGETWFYTVENKSTIVDHGTWKQEDITGFIINVYNAEFNLVGTVEDDIEFKENETRVAQIDVASLLTQKFFNYDTNYELMVMISLNTVEYTNNTRTLVYGLESGKTVSETIGEIEGYYVDAVNTARDAWSEQYWITFTTEEETLTPTVGGIMNAGDYVFKTYKYAGYSGMGDPVLECRLPMITSAGQNYVPFISTVKYGRPYFATNRLKYSWFEDPFNYENENPTADNELQVDLYSTESSWGSNIVKFSSTAFPLATTAADRFFLYVGAFSYSDDLSFGRYTADNVPAFIITKEKMVGADAYTYFYDVYKGAAQGADAEGEHLLSLASEVDGGYFMADIPGFDPQVMFTRTTGSGYVFDFTSLITGEIEHSVPVAATGLSLTAATDRIPYGDGYLYVAAQTHGESQPNGDMHSFVAFFNPDGSLHHLHTLNLGQLVDYATIYTAPDAFDPYIFNLDSKQEYMAIVKRRNGVAATGNHEELVVVSEDPEAEPLFVYTPDDGLGTLATVYFANLATTPRMIVVTAKDNKYISTAYTLPVKLFDEGDGTEANPYVITTMGGLQQMRFMPSAHYVLGTDIDAAGTPVAFPEFDFSGSFDGLGHSISNLLLDGNSLFPAVARPASATEGSKAGTIANLNLVDPVFNAVKDAHGILVGQIRGGVIRNVHVYGAKVNTEVDAAGLVGGVYLGSVVEECSVNADIVGSEDSSLGGIALNTRTGGIIRACAFNGTIAGGQTLGGIVADFGHADDVLENCHVKASISGKNTIGGIAGSSAHGTIRFCHVEGDITASEAPRWGGGPKTGGIVGDLAAFPGDPSGEEEVEPNIAIEGCYVNLSSLTFTGEPSSSEEYPGQNDTMHRIVGSSAANGYPEYLGEDSDYNPIWGNPAAPEAGLKNNYAVNTLDVVNSDIADATGTTEGMSVDPYETGMGFFTELGWLYGFDAENPWSYTGDQLHPSLYFEGGLLVIDPEEATIKVDDEITLTVSCKGGSITEDDLGGFTMEMTDETVLETLEMGMVGEDIVLSFKAIKEGNVKLTVGLKGKTVESNITVKSAAGITDAVADGSAISFDGTVVTAPACDIDVYTTMGVRVLSARDSADLSRLGGGVFIVTARPVNGGAASTLKVHVK